MNARLEAQPNAGSRILAPSTILRYPGRHVVEFGQAWETDA